MHRCWLSPRSLKGLAKAAKKTAILHPGQEKGRFPRGLAHDEESKFYFKAIHHAAAAAAPAFTVYTWLYTPFYVLFPRRAFFSLFIFCTVKSFFPSFFLHKGEDFVLCMCVGGIEPTNSPHEGQRKRPWLLLLFICNFTQRLI